MSNTLVITVLVENSVQGRELMAEHGLAFHIQAGANTMLFDTGQSGLVLSNARGLGMDLSRLRAIALSHGHYDHTGGLRAVRDIAPDAQLYTHPGALGPHFTRNPDGTTRNLGMSKRTRESILAGAQPFCPTTGPTEVLSGVFLTGEIPRITDFEDVGGPFVLDDAGRDPDPILDDQALFFDTQRGVAVILGCAHAGVLNTMRYIQQLTNGRPIHTVVGGMHLLNATTERIVRTAEALRELGVQRIGPAHCTGIAATARLWNDLPGTCTACGVGNRFAFQR